MQSKTVWGLNTGQDARKTILVPFLKGWKVIRRQKVSKLFQEKSLSKSFPMPVICRQNGIIHSSYKLPMTVYSDRRLPLKGELNRLETNYDRLRLQLFQESSVYDTLLANEMYPDFANSFLLLISKEKMETSTVYAKFSNEQAPEFSIITEICENNKNEKIVRKVPTDIRAEAHIKTLPKIEEELSGFYGGEGLKLNACRTEADGAVLEYLDGETLEARLDSLLEQGKLEELGKTFVYLY